MEIKEETKSQTVKIEVEIPSNAFEFAEKYAKLCNKDPKILCQGAMITKLAELREIAKKLPFVPQHEKDPWKIN